MNLEDITDTQRTTRKMKLAVKSGNVSKKVKELTKQKAEDGRNTANYDSGVNMSDEDTPSPDLSSGVD